MIKVHSRSDHDLRVGAVGLLMQDGSGRTINQIRQPPGATIPGVVPAHDSLMTCFTLEWLRKECGFDPQRPTEA